MDFGGFLALGLLALGLLVGGPVVVVLFIRRSPLRWRGVGFWAIGLAVLAISGRYLYRVYGLDERLFLAAARGDAAGVEAWLAAGASPDADFEGTSAIEAARRRGHGGVVTILEKAGAR
jgi:hypothetical protein